VYSYNLRTQEAEAGGAEFEAKLGYVVSTCLKKNKKRKKYGNCLSPSIHPPIHPSIHPSIHMHTEERLCTARRQTFAILEDSLHQKPNSSL
jgi:hypothetical protein